MTVTDFKAAALFWDELSNLSRSAARLPVTEARERLTRLAAQSTGDSDLDAARQEVLRHTARTIGADLPALAHPPAPPLALAEGPLPPISPGGQPGTSLVTCCMNREANLLRALDSWLACPELREIIIVDWSSDRPVRDALAEKGIADSRIRVLRVEGEARWILSYAFNAGFRAASCSRILKADADIVLDPEFFAANRLFKGSFIAGNWRKAAKGQAYVNGFFYVHKSDLAAIAGFNEHITTYGWDDDDIYARLTDHGLARRDVDPATIRHLDHSDEERTGEAAGAAGPLSALEELQAGTMFKIRQNRFLANTMPYWGPGQKLLPFEVTEAGPGGATLRRQGWVPHPVPPAVQADAAHYAALEMTAWRLGKRVFHLERAQLAKLLEKPFADLTRLDVELLLHGHQAGLAGGALVARLDAAAALPGRALEALAERARTCGLTLVLSGPFAALPQDAPAAARACPFVPDWENLGELAPLPPEDLAAPPPRAPGQHFELRLDAAALAALDSPAAPAVQPDRPRLYIDGQHGLGNRLRAIGSAAAVAGKTGRELVIVWQPDAHCDCRFSDLFDYDGAVIEEAFVSEAASRGLRTYNYMEIEDGAEKDAPVDTAGSASLYARSAYVLNSPLSTWEDENRFLQTLKPVAEVQEMVAGVRTPNDVSAHVRMAGGKAYEHLPYEQSEGNWSEEGHQAIAHWREKSHFSHFFKRLDALTAEGRAERIFVAADLPETYAEFRAIYGSRVAMLERDVYDRSAEQLRYALADALLLGSSPLLLGSSWSSFSELAMRLSPQKMEIEMSGKDF